MWNTGDQGLAVGACNPQCNTWQCGHDGGDCSLTQILDACRPDMESDAARLLSTRIVDARSNPIRRQPPRREPPKRCGCDTAVRLKRAASAGRSRSTSARLECVLCRSWHGRDSTSRVHPTRDGLVPCVARRLDWPVVDGSQDEDRPALVGPTAAHGRVRPQARQHADARRWLVEQRSPRTRARPSKNIDADRQAQRLSVLMCAAPQRSRHTTRTSTRAGHIPSAGTRRHTSMPAHTVGTRRQSTAMQACRG